MAKGDEIRQEYVNGDIVCWSPKYAKTDLDWTDPEAPSIMLGLLRCEAAAPAPEYPTVRNMTGRYESKSNMCCVNQAGFHMELWYSFGSGGRGLFRYGGDYRSDSDPAAAVFELREASDTVAFFDLALDSPTRTTPAGLLVVEGHDTFRIVWPDGKVDKFRRFSRRATLSDRALKQVRAANLGGGNSMIEGWLDDEQRPISERAFKTLRDYLLDRGAAGDERLSKLLQTLFRIELGGGALHADDLNSAIRAISATITKHYHFDEVDEARVAARILPYLMSRRLDLFNPSGVLEERSLYEWLQRVVAYRNPPLVSASVRPITRLLRVEAPQQYRYELEGAFETLGIDASLPFASKFKKLAKRGKVLAKKGLAKILDRIEKFRWDWGQTLKKHRKQIEEKIIEKVGGKIADLLEAHAGGKIIYGVLLVRAPDGGWEGAYDVVAGLVAGGIGGTQLGFESLTAKGWAESNVDWKPSNFPGEFAILPGVMAEDAYGSRAEKQMIWLLDGGGATGKLQLVFNEVTTDASDADLGWGYGFIDDLEQEDVKHHRFPSVPMFEYTTQYDHGETVQFQLGSATVRDSARQMLRIFAANELALLRDPTSRVAIEGFADRLGQKWYNDQLSAMRAANVGQALMDCLGDDLVAKTASHAHGEDMLAGLGEAFFPDEKPNEQWRRVFVVMNAQVAATMGTTDPKLKRRKR